MVIKELDYFNIDGCIGGNQEWLSDFFMRVGGCAAVTACDCAIYLALYKGQTELYPYDINNLNKVDFKEFTNIMKNYLKPRLKGINILDLYISGVNAYMYDRNYDRIHLEGFRGEQSYEEARDKIIEQIDAGVPIPYLLLHHRDKAIADYVWHWFLVTGYVQCGDKFKVKITTYGECQWLDLDNLWDTGYKEKGGMIIAKWKIMD